MSLLGKHIVTTAIELSYSPALFFEKHTHHQPHHYGVFFLCISMFFPIVDLAYFVQIQTVMMIMPVVMLGSVFVAWLWAEYVRRVLALLLRLEVDRHALFRVFAYASAPSILHVTLILSPVAIMWQHYLM